LAALIFCGKAAAQTLVWTNGDGNELWSDGANFSVFSLTGPFKIDFKLGNFEYGPVMSSVDANTYSISTLSICGAVAYGLNLSSVSGGSLNISSSLVDTSPSPVSISVPIAGTASVSSSGGGSLTLSGANTYSGGTSITGRGELVIGSSSTGVNSNVSVGPVGTGTLMLGSGTYLTTADSSCYTLGNTINLCGDGTVYLLYGPDDRMLTLKGMITGSAGLEVASGSEYPDYLALTSRWSTFGGGVSVDAGNTTLAVGRSSTGTGGNVTKGPLGTGTLMLSSDNTFTTVGSRSITIGNDIMLCGSSDDWIYLLYSHNNPRLTLSGMISGSPVIEVASTSYGGSNYYLALTSGCSTFSGGIQVDAGNTTLAVGASSTGPGDNVTAGPLGTGTLMLSNGNNFTTVDSNCYTIGNTITLCGSSEDTVKLLYGNNGSPMLTLSGTISGYPALEVASTNTNGGSSYYLALTSGSSTFSGGLSVDAGNTTLAVGASSLSEEGSVYQGPLGTGPLMLSNGNNFTTVDSNCYTIGNNVTLCGGGTVTLLGGSSGTMLELDGTITGSSALKIAAPSSSSNTVVLTSPSSTFGGGVTVDAGNSTLVVGASGVGTAGSPTSSPLGTGSLTLGNGTTLATPNGVPITVLNNIFLGTGESNPVVTLGGTPSGVLTILGSISDKHGPSSLVIDGPTDLEGYNEYSGGTTVSSTTLTVGNDSGLGFGPVTAIGSTLNFISSTPTINNLSMQASVINFAASSNPFINGMESDLPGSTNQINLGNGATLTFRLGEDPDYYGKINGNGAVNVQGYHESLSLYGTNTYTGGTTIGSNMLVVAGNASALGTGMVTINSGGILGVDNGITIANQITLNNGGEIGGYGAVAPATPETITFASGSGVTGGRGSLGGGDALHPVIGTLSFGANASLEFAGGGAMQFSIMNALGTPGVDYSTISVAGNLNLTATSLDPFTIQLVGVDYTGLGVGTANTFNSGQSYQWTLLSAGSITNFDASAFHFDTSTYFSNAAPGTFFVTDVGNDLVLNFTPVPEPSTWMLMASGVLALGAAVRRRRR
jgi:autotransporter-associated beta strand protein